jgi:biotin transporter BioY
MKKKKKRHGVTAHQQVKTRAMAHRFAVKKKKIVTASVDDLLNAPLNEPSKTVWEKTQQHPLWNGFSLWVLLLAGFVLFLGSMVFLPVSNWAIGVLQQYPNASLFTPPLQVGYCLQFPLFVLLVAWLGPRLGSLFLFSYLLIGLVGVPLFSGGGGWQYVLKPTFGYWLGALIVLPWMVQQGQLLLLRGGNLPQWKVVLNASLLAINTVLLMHTLGLLYLVMLGLCGQFPWEHVREVAVFYSLVSLPYDCLGALVALALVRYLRFGTALFLYI